MKHWKVILVAGGLLFLAANRDFRTLVHNYMDLRALAREEARLEREYQELQREKARLLNEKDDYLEEIARLDLNLAKPDELEFRFPPPKKEKK